MEGITAPASPTREALDGLLTDFLASPEPLHDIAARHALSLAQALAHLQSAETRAFLESVIALGDLRTRVQASMGAPQALTSLRSLLPAATGPECRRTAAAILRATEPRTPRSPRPYRATNPTPPPQAETRAHEVAGPPLARRTPVAGAASPRPAAPGLPVLPGLGSRAEAE
jgi:hypothetical protein